MKTTLILALLGQCYAGRGVVQQGCYRAQTYAAPTYAAPAYNQVYQVPYVEKVKFVAVEQPGYDYYAALAAAASRGYERFQEYAQVPQQQAVTYSIPSPQPVQAPTPVYQAPAPSKVDPSPQYPVAQATPQHYQAQATPQQQQVYQAPAPAKAPPQLQTPAKNPTPGDGGNIPPPIIQQRLDYSSAMGDSRTDVPPPPPTPMYTPPQAHQQPQMFQPEPVITAVNSHFMSVLTKNCASCHTGMKSKGGFQIFDYPGRLANLTQDDLQNMYTQVISNKMPFKRVMSQADRQALVGMISGNVSPVVSR